MFSAVRWWKGRGVDCEKYPFVQDKSWVFGNTPKRGQGGMVKGSVRTSYRAFRSTRRHGLLSRNNRERQIRRRCDAEQRGGLFSLGLAIPKSVVGGLDAALTRNVDLGTERDGGRCGGNMLRNGRGRRDPFAPRRPFR